jgi:hypothetical protein
MQSHRRQIWLTVALLGLLTSTGAGAQTPTPSGMMLRQTLTFLPRTPAGGGPAADVEMDFEVTPVSAGTQTELWVEFGPDGNVASPPPDPMLPNSVTFTLTNATTHVSRDLMINGPVDTTFQGKLVTFVQGHGDPSNQKGLYVLDIVHLIAINTKEDWSLKLANLPSNLRAVSSINQAFFTKLIPAGSCLC